MVAASLIDYILVARFSVILLSLCLLFFSSGVHSCLKNVKLPVRRQEAATDTLFAVSQRKKRELVLKSQEKLRGLLILISARNGSGLKQKSDGSPLKLLRALCVPSIKREFPLLSGNFARSVVLFKGGLMAIVFPNPARVPVSSKYGDKFTPEKPTDVPAIIANIAAEEAGDTGTISTVSKLARSILKLLNATKSISKEIGDSVISHLSSVIDTIKVLSIFKSIKAIVDNSKKKDKETKSEKAQRILKIAGAVTGITVASMTAVRLLDGFKLLKIANISKAMGITSIVSAPLRAALSFSVVFSAVEIIENFFTITVSSLKMHDLNKKVKRAKERIDLWKKKSDKPIDQIAAGKIQALPDKRKALIDQAAILAPPVEETGVKYTEAKAAYDKIKKKAPKKSCFAKLSRQCSLKKAEAKLKRAGQKHTQACKKFDAVKGSFDKKGTKLKRWEVIADKFQADTLTKQDKTLLKTFKEDKEAKWKLKVKSITWDKVKEGLTLGMALYLTVFLVSVIALAITFPVALPAGAVLGLAVGGLILSSGFAVKHLYTKIMDSEWGKKTHKPVSVPELEVLEEIPF